jgi:hypothetical protein
MKLKELHVADIAEIQEAVTDELKKAQKINFSAAVQKLYERAEAWSLWNFFEYESYVSSSCVLDF